MSYCTTEDILKKWESPESRQEAREMADLRKDIMTASNAISDALARYRKTKLRSRSKKKAQEDPFAELADYESRQQIQDDYGWGFITEKRMDYLIELWDAREESKKAGGTDVYRDRVTEMLELALATVGANHMETLHDYDNRMRKIREDAAQIARENNERTRQRELGMGV